MTGGLGGGETPVRATDFMALGPPERASNFGESTMSKGNPLQDSYLNTLRKERIPVSVYLVNGIKLQGQIESFDQFVIVLRNAVSQMVYKHAVSTVVPARNVRLQPTGMRRESRGEGRGESSGESSESA